MKFLTAGALVILGTFSTIAVSVYEPFSDATASGGTAYEPGSSLVGQTNSQGLTWFAAGAGPAGPLPVISGTNLSYSGSVEGQGGSAFFGAAGTGARLGFGAATTNGTIYYSFLLDIPTAIGMSSSGVSWFGFKTLTGTQSVGAVSVGTQVITRAAGSGFQIGLVKSSPNLASAIFDPTIYSDNTAILVVGSYTFNSGSAGNDVSKMWVNPASLGGAEPAATLTSSAGPDLGRIISVVLFQQATAEPAIIGHIDELRVGNTFAEVTTVPEPAAGMLMALGLLALTRGDGRK